MKKLLLLFALVALCGTTVSAQTAIKKVKPLSKEMLQGMQKQKSLEATPFQSELKRDLAISAKPSTRYTTEEAKDPQELSFLFPPYTADRLGYVLMAYSSSTGTEVGWGSIYTAEMTKKFVGNTTNFIEFFAQPGDYTDGIVFIQDMQTGDVVWAQEVDEITEYSYNSVDCDYEFDGHPIFVGWQATMSTSTSMSTFPYIALFVYPCYGSTGCYFYDADDQYWYNYSGQISFGEGYPSYAANYVAILTEGEGGFRQYDVENYGVDPMRVKQGETASTYLYFKNLGCQPVSSVTYTYECEGQTKTETVDVDELQFMQGVGVQIEIPTPAVSGHHAPTFTITQAGGQPDEAEDGNVAEGQLVTFADAYPRNMVIEEWTSNTCGWCPRGIVGLEKAAAVSESRIVPIAVHTTYVSTVEDPLSCATYLSTLQTLASGFPSCSFNREENDADPYYGGINSGYSDIAVDAQMFLENVCEAQLDVKSAISGSTVGVTCDVTLSLDAAAGDYSLAYVVTEDGITGVDQLNYYYGYEEKYEETLPDDLHFLNTAQTSTAYSQSWYQPTYNHVARYIFNPMGADKKLGAIAAGATVQDDASFTLPAGVDTEKCHICALLIDNATGYIVTGAQNVLGSDQSGIAEVELNDVKAAQYYGIDGRRVQSPVQGGVYIQRQGTSAKKVLF